MLGSSWRSVTDRGAPFHEGEMRMNEQHVVWQVGVQSVTASSLNSVYWLEDGATKSDTLRYYLTVAAYLMSHLRDTPENAPA